MSAKSIPSIKDRIKAATLPEQVVSIVLDRALHADLQRLEDQLTQAQAKRQVDARFKTDVRKIAEQIVAKRDEMQASVIEFTVRGLPAAQWRDLKAEHPMPQGSQKVLDQMIVADSGSLLDAAVPLCVVEPELDAEDWAALADVLTTGDTDRLREATIAVNEDGTSVPFVRTALQALGPSDDDSK